MRAHQCYPFDTNFCVDNFTIARKTLLYLHSLAANNHYDEVIPNHDSHVAEFAVDVNP